MQILDDGRVTDSQGRTVSFKNTILIMTSNLGSQAILEGMSAGQRDAVKDTVMSMVGAWSHIFMPSRRHPEPCKPCEGHTFMCGGSLTNPHFSKSAMQQVVSTDYTMRWIVL